MPSFRLSSPLAAAAVCLLTLWAAAPALAHRVNIFAYVDGRDIVVECAFSRSAKVRQGLVEVFDAATDAKLLEGRTNDDGEFRFPVPAADIRNGHGLRLHINAGEGHRNTWTIDAAELDGASSPAVSAAPAEASAPSGTSANASPAAPSVPPARGAWATPEDVERIVNEALDTRLAPVKRLLAEQSEAGPDLADVIGGIGWIFGLAGVAACFRRRR